MTYVPIHDSRTAAKRAADRAHDEQWMHDRNVARVQDPAPLVQYGPPVPFASAH